MFLRACESVSTGVVTLVKAHPTTDKKEYYTEYVLCLCVCVCSCTHTHLCFLSLSLERFKESGHLPGTASKRVTQEKLESQTYIIHDVNSICILYTR